MAPVTSVLHTVILLGIVQGFIMSGLLFFSKKQRYANRLLAVLILLITLASVNLYGTYNNWGQNNTVRLVFDIIPLVVIMPFGPLIYFYVQAFSDPAFRISRQQRRHFLPVIIDFVPGIIVIVFIAGLLLHVFNAKIGPAWGNFIDTYNVYADVPRWACISIYVWLSIKHLAGLKAKNAMEPQFNWLKQFLQVLLAFQAIWLVFLIPYVIPGLTDKLLDAVDWYPIYIPMAIMVYWLGIKGYMASQAPVAAAKVQPAPQTVLPAGLIQQAITALENAMQQDKLYLNPALSVDVVAKHVQLPPKTISAVLNQHINKSFNEYINGYRINEFKERVLQPDTDNFTIAGIAQDCGFNSQATFQRSFKQVTGLSPSEYRKREIMAG